MQAFVTFGKKARVFQLFDLAKYDTFVHKQTKPTNNMWNTGKAIRVHMVRAKVTRRSTLMSSESAWPLKYAYYVWRCTWYILPGKVKVCGQTYRKKQQFVRRIDRGTYGPTLHNTIRSFDLGGGDIKTNSSRKYMRHFFADMQKRDIERQNLEKVLKHSG